MENEYILLFEASLSPDAPTVLTRVRSTVSRHGTDSMTVSHLCCGDEQMQNSVFGMLSYSDVPEATTR